MNMANGKILDFGEKEEPKKIIAIEAQCWSCNQIWNISLLPPDAKDIKCTCGGYVVTPSGKVMVRGVKKEVM